MHFGQTVDESTGPASNAYAGTKRDITNTSIVANEITFFIIILLSHKPYISGWLMGNYGQVLVVLTRGMLLPFTVASTVNVYCKPLVTALLALWVRLPTPEAYQVATQLEPCHS